MHEQILKNILVIYDVKMFKLDKTNKKNGHKIEWVGNGVWRTLEELWGY